MKLIEVRIVYRGDGAPTFHPDAVQQLIPWPIGPLVGDLEGRHQNGDHELRLVYDEDTLDKYRDQGVASKTEAVDVSSVGWRNS